MILGKSELENIAQRIDFIRLQLGDLNQFDNLNWKTYKDDRNIQRNVERLVEHVANATIDICKIVLAGKDIEMPNSYKDIILGLGYTKVIGEDLANKLVDYVSLRNFLAHEYLDLKWDKIKGFIKEAPSNYDKFISAVSKIAF